jgi:hypothetical protein
MEASILQTTRLLWFFIPFLFPFGLASAGGPDILDPLTECPASHPACMLFDIYLKTPGVRIDDRPPYTKIISEDPDKYDNVDVPIVVDVLGRLNGAPEKMHRVAFPDGRGSEMVCLDSRAATIGVDDGGQGTILTNQGALQITDPTVDVGIRSSLKVIDGTTLNESRRATPEWQSHFFRDKLAMASYGRAYWRQNDICLDTDSGPLFQQVPGERCSGAKLTPARPRIVEMVRRTERYKDDHEIEYLWEIEGSNLVVYLYPIACT